MTGPAGERCAVIIHGQRWELCLNDATARAVGEALLGPVDAQARSRSGPAIDVATLLIFSMLVGLRTTSNCRVWIVAYKTMM